MNTSYKIGAALYLNLLALSPDATVFKADTATDYIFVVDVSGSMDSELPMIRRHIKVRLATELRPGDRFSLLVYSGRGQCHKVVEGMDLRDVSSITALQRAVDSWVKSIGMTAFVDPLVASREIAVDLRKSKPNNGVSIVWMTDGRDNSYSRGEILAACDALRSHVDSATIVEYGMWADRSLLTAMAERLGGSLAYVDSSAAYATLTTQVVGKSVKSAKLRTVDVGEGAWLAFALGDGTMSTYAVNASVVEVPDVPMTLAVLSRDPMGAVRYPLVGNEPPRNQYGNQHEQLAHAYAAVALLSLRSQPKPMYEILRALGDVALIDTLSTCFGKQAYTNASALAQAAAFNAKARWVRGFDQSKVPRDDAFTVVDLVRLLADEGAELDELATKVARIGPARVDAATQLTPEEVATVKAKMDAAVESRDVEALGEVGAFIEALRAAKGPALKFVPSSDRAKITGVKWNMKEANLSIDVRRPGHVDLSAIPNDLFETANLPHQSELVRAGVPTRFETAITRTRPLVASGIRNVDKIVVYANERVWQKLVDEGAIDCGDGYVERIEIDMARVPLTNMRARDGLSASHLVKLHWRLIKINAQSKVYEHFRDTYPRTDWIVEKYGSEAANWLDGVGVKRYGYSPAQRGSAAKSGDVREKREMLVKVESFSNLPKVVDVLARMKPPTTSGDDAKGKKAKKAPATLTPAMELLAVAVRANDAFLASPEYTSVGSKDGQALLHQEWLDRHIEALDKEANNLRADIASATFTAIVGQGGFVEYAGEELRDKYELTDVVTPDGTTVNATIEFKTSMVDL